MLFYFGHYYQNGYPMRAPHDHSTSELLPTPRRRGRPSTGTALTPAQKQARYRQRQRARSVTVTFDRAAIDALDTHIRALVAGLDAPIPPEHAASILESIRSATLAQLAPVAE
ncbi:hypothetical protein [Aeromonas veronii]|uniref:hypothetical protein n=1 Tax=Aeromonas veronii TaxID=654 RepID=UPI003BA335C1